MSRSERDVLEAMDRAVMDPPPMSLSPDSVVALGRSKVRRRRAAGAGMSIAAAAVAVTAWVGLSSGFDVLGDQIAPADELSASVAELQLEVVDEGVRVSDGVGLDTTIALDDLEGGWTAPGPEGTTYVVDRDWPQDTRTFALVRDPATGITTVSPVKTVPDAPTGYVGATVPAGPTGAPLDVVSLSALVGEPSECNLHAPEAYPVTPGGGPSGQVAAVQLLADDRHWTGCVVGDVFAGDLQEPTAQWRGNAMVPVGSWQDGFPDGIVTVLPDEARWTEEPLVPVWEGEPAFELDEPVAMPAGVGRAMALDWSLPLERLGRGDTENLLGFDATGDGKVDIPLLPLGTNRALTDGLPLAVALDLGASRTRATR